MKITINDVVINRVRRDFVLNDRLDEELDTGIIAFYSLIGDEYLPMSVVKIFITNDTTPDHFFLVDTDQVTLVTKTNPKYYLHTIGLIEPTKLLERYYVESLAFTQPTDPTESRYSLGEALSRIRNIVPLEEAENLSATRKYNIDNTMLTQLNAIKAPQFFFNNQNLFQVLAEIFKYVDSIPRIETYSGSTPVLTRTDFNKITELITLNNLSNLAKSNNGEYFVNKIEMNIENGITSVVETYPAARNYSTLTTESFIITTKDVEFVLPNPIYNIKSFKILLKYRDETEALFPQGENKFTYVEKDITDIVYEEDLFNALKIDDPNEDSKYGSLVYKKGDNRIKGFGLAFPQLWGIFSSTTMEEFHNRPDIKFINNGTYQVIIEQGGMGETILRGYLGFKIEYFPYINQRATIQKQSYLNNNDFTLYTNQGGRSIDISRLLTNGQSVLNRIGNGDLTVEKTVLNYNDRFKLGQMTSDNFIVSNVETMVNGNYFRTKAMLTKNFNRLSSFIGVDRDIRQFEMPLREVVDRNLKYEEYVVIDTIPVFTTNSSRWTNSRIDWLRFMFQNLQPVNNTITGAIIATKSSTNDEDRIGTFYMSVAKSYYKNSNLFHFRFVNNQVAYYYPIRETGAGILASGISQKAIVRYVLWNENDPSNILNGTMRYMDFNLIDNDIYKNVIDLCVPATNRDAAFNFWNANKITYPNGLFFYLGTATTDVYGVTSRFIYVSEYLGNTYIACYQPDQILLDLLHNKGTGSSQFRYLGLSPNNPQTFYQRNTPFNNTTVDERYLKSNYAAMKLTNLYVDKDPAETISMTYQLQFVSRKPYIIIGNTFSENSPYMVNRANLTANQRNLHFYRSTEYYREGEFKAKGTKTTTAFSGFSISAATGGFILIRDTNIGSPSITGFNSWAIGDNDGNLYLAVNRQATFITTFVFFQFQNKL